MVSDPKCLPILHFPNSAKKLSSIVAAAGIMFSRSHSAQELFPSGICSRRWKVKESISKTDRVCYSLSNVAKANIVVVYKSPWARRETLVQIQSSVYSRVYGGWTK